MQQVHTISNLRGRLDDIRSRGQRVGMVGTSGLLHSGHLSLIERSAADNDVTAMYWGGGASFGWMNSQIAYERDADRDFALAENAGLDLIFAPSNDELFSREPMTAVSLAAMSSGVPYLEEPQHLDLIAMVMSKLWNIFGPCRAYFGEKDWQQLALFQRLADDLAWPVEVIGCPTVREIDGLAISSRNERLTADERALAPAMYQALCACRDAALGGTRKRLDLADLFTDIIGDPECIRYFAAVEAATMQPLEELTDQVRLLASIELGSVRLLDNVGLDIAP